MKIEQNQQIRSIGIISTFLLMAACVLASAPVWNGAESENSEKTMHRAESLAYQILEIQNASFSSRSSSGRQPASEGSTGHLDADEGQVGLDPWGHPFHFKILSNTEHRNRVLVWSLGPNGKAETPEEKLDSNRDSVSAEFLGDDLGVMVSIK